MTDKQALNELDPQTEDSEDRELESRRAFLLGLGKWSRAVIVGAVAGGALLTDRPAQAGWINRRGGVIPGGGSWINGNSGGGSWVNRRGGGWGGSWVNRR